MNKPYDVCIVGGGASGLAAAVYIKQTNKNISVVVLERLSRVGKKLITTGNGRCNITNKDEDISHYHGENTDFAGYALKTYDNARIKNFFYSVGVPLRVAENGRIYPASLQASSVVDALRFACDALGADIFTDCKVTDITAKKGGYSLKTEKGEFFAERVVFAAGLYSGGVRLGCDGGALKLLESKGLDVVKTTPAIVQIKTENDIARALKGIKINAVATLVSDGKPMRSEEGEVLFCDYGLSGPPILQIAREIERQPGEKTVRLDIMPYGNFGEILFLLNSMKAALGYRNLDEYLSGVLSKRLGQAVVKRAGLKLSLPVAELKESDINNIAAIIKNFSFKVISTTGFENSQVTAGGLATSGFDSKTMMSVKYKNLYAVGEILDIDGDCGGYNLHFAFSSAMCAAESILRNYVKGLR